MSLEKNTNTVVLPVIALRGLVIFPKSVITIDVGRQSSIRAIEAAYEADGLLFATMQADIQELEPKAKDLSKIGTVVKVVQIFEGAENSIKIIVEGIDRAESLRLITDKPYFKGEVKILESIETEETNAEQEALLRVAIDIFEEYVSMFNKVSTKILMDIFNCTQHGKLADLICENVYLKLDVKQKILEELNGTERLNYTIKKLQDEINVLKIQKELRDKVIQSIDEKQKEYILREQIKVIQEELSKKTELDDEIALYKNQIQAKNPPQYVIDKFNKELKRLSRSSASSPEGLIIRDYLECLIDLPWNETSKENISFDKAIKTLEKEHFGISKVKDRIIEFLAVRQVKSYINAPILCLVGPPGVGKTSIVKSIAKALERKFAIISLGGVRDEADVRGHRKTYIGAMPGRIIYSLKQAKTNNPIILLDEIDKINSDFKGDPAAALLEVLDLEQNSTFRDHYLEIPYDLSNIMFICTANSTATIPIALKDRLEIIELSSYTTEEKVNIGTKFLYPKQLKKHNLRIKNLRISKDIMQKIILGYTKEAGVRELERIIEKICRKVVKQMLVNNDKTQVILSNDNLVLYLGNPKFKQHKIFDKPQVGIAKGLAWTVLGGDTLSIEVNIMPGKGKIELTGNLGTVMKESAKTAISYVRSNYKKFNIETNFYKNCDIHIHIPEGAVPKDGPSAGITLATAVISALTDLKVRNDVAMTGEITLRGRVLPIGGLKEKVLAAKSIGIKTVIIPFDNEGDLLELENYVKEGIKFVLVKEMQEVLNIAFLKTEE